ncbi:hypothetical protein ACPA9J_26265 [Pseudomonas aeruginosa]
MPEGLRHRRRGADGEHRVQRRRAHQPTPAIGTEIGTGMSTSQAFVVGDFLGRPADEVKTAETEWPECGSPPRAIPT